VIKDDQAQAWTSPRPSFAISARMGSHGVADLGRCPYTAGAGAVGTAEEPALHLNSMADDPTLAVFAYRRQPLDGTLERVERMYLASGVDLERHPVVVAAYLTCRHTRSRYPDRGTANRLGDREQPPHT
jgi:hypothetical protein